MLATIAAAQAPMRNLPSMAMLSMPLRSDRMPAKAPSEIGTAYSRLPGEDAGQVGGLAVEQRGEDRDDPQRDDDQQRAAPRERGRRGSSWPMPTAPVDDAGQRATGRRRSS